MKIEYHEHQFLKEKNGNPEEIIFNNKEDPGLHICLKNSAKINTRIPVKKLKLKLALAIYYL